MFTPEQVAALEAPLNRSHVKGRKQGGREVSYIEGWHAEAEANRIFGYDGWDSVVVAASCVSERPRKIGQDGKEGWAVTYTATVRVTVTAGDKIIVRDGAGAGHGIDVDCGQAHESALKEATTDAEKRALKTFGNPFGLALYDKTQANVMDERQIAAKEQSEGAAAFAIKALKACQTADDFKATWEKNKDAWKEVMGATGYAIVVEAMKVEAKRFAPKSEDAA